MRDAKPAAILVILSILAILIQTISLPCFSLYPRERATVREIFSLATLFTAHFRELSRTCHSTLDVIPAQAGIQRAGPEGHEATRPFL
ncbi:MAG: hypothetical protein ACE15F_07935 [bacterium]